MKSLLTSTFWLTSILFIWSCGKDADQAQPTPVETITADSTSFSTLLINCKSSDSSITGIAVIDIQNYFLSKNIVKTIVNGKLLTLTRSELPSYFDVINQLVTDFELAQSYFISYSSFADLIEEKLKSKNGFKKSNSLNSNQIEQLFNKESIVMAYQGGSFLNSLFASKRLVKSDLGLILLDGLLIPESIDFSINNLLATMTIGVEILGASNNYNTLGKLITDKSSIKSTVLATGYNVNQFIYRNYQYNTYIDGIGFSGPPIVYDAPVWYWHQYKTPNFTTAGIDLAPLNSTIQNFNITDFSKSLVPLSFNNNAKINGSVVDFTYTGGGNSYAEISLKSLSDLKNGFESTCEFSFTNETSLILETKLLSYNGFFSNLLGINTIPISNTKDFVDVEFALPGTASYTLKDFVKISDGKKHTLKMVFSNSSSLLALIYLDNVLIGTQAYSASFYDYNVQTLKQMDARRKISLIASGSGVTKIYSWKFKAY